MMIRIHYAGSLIDMPAIMLSGLIQPAYGFRISADASGELWSQIIPSPGTGVKNQTAV